MSKKKKIKLDKYHYHEALDRSCCVADIIENMLVTHPVIEQDKKIRKHIKKAQKHILTAYQLIGGKDV